jgi:hypothetical protein
VRKLILVAALGLVAAVGLPAHATTATGTFDVTINLTSACQVVSTPAATFTYTSFQGAAATFANTFNIKCTNTLPITSVTLDSGAVTDDATNLAYTLSLAGVPAAGTGANQSITLNGSMASGQAGTCAAATCSNAAATNKTRTITITY